MSSIESPFSPAGLQPAIAERDQRIAVLEYQLRCARAEADARERSTEAAGAPAERPAVAAASSWLSSWLGTDEGGVPISQRERRTLNALVRRYLLARGYKATSAAFAEEAGGPAPGSGGSGDVALADAELELLALPRAQGSSDGGGRAVLSLLGMHRKRIAPIQQLAESEARNDSTITALHAEVAELHAQLDIVRAELAKSDDRAAQVCGWEGLQRSPCRRSPPAASATCARRCSSSRTSRTRARSGGGSPPPHPPPQKRPPQQRHRLQHLLCSSPWRVRCPSPRLQPLLPLLRVGQQRWAAPCRSSTRLRSFASSTRRSLR